MNETSVKRRGGLWLVMQCLVFALIAWIPDPKIMHLGESARELGSSLGLNCLMMALIIMVWQRFRLSPFPRPKDNVQLITSGPYAIVRHPVYTLIFLASLGWGVGSSNLARILLSFALLGFFDLKSRQEERGLKDIYPEYEFYAEKVSKKFIPWVY